MSKYDSIKTASDLVADVQLNGLSTDQEDICRAQDIFGHTSIEELARLANDTGMNNAQGEPDRKATRGTFYMIVTSIWNWEEVTRFWNLYTNPQTEELKELRKEHKKLGGLYDSLLAHRDELEAEQKANNDAIAVLKSRAGDAQRRAEEAEAEVVRLKAKLYDLLVERKEAV